MNLVIDVQGFKIEKNKFIVKEFAAFDGEKICHYVFKPPFPYDMLPHDLKKQAHWLMKHHHCINWNDGFTPLHKFGNILAKLTQSVSNIYIKGAEKADYIRQFTSKPVYELEEWPALKISKVKCFYHFQSNCMCALSNVYYLYENFIMT